MKSVATDFWSDGLRLDANFYHDEEALRNDTPAVIGCSGFTGLMNIHPERFARALTPRGFLCFGFDYRGFGKSEGTPRHVTTEEQSRDITHAIDFVRQHKLSLGRRVFVIGWGMAGGLIIEATRTCEPPAGLIPINGFYDALRVQRAVRGEGGFEKFWADYQSERAARAFEAKPDRTDPYAIYPLDPVTETYVDNVLRKTDGFSGEVNFSFAESLLRFRPERNLEHLETTPMLIAHGAENALHPPLEARTLHEKYPGPSDLLLLENAGHTEWMLDDNPIFQTLMERIAAWIMEA